MNLVDRHPVIEGAAGGVLTSLGTFLHFANEYLTPALSFFTAAVGALFSAHAIWRWARRHKHTSTATDRRGDTPTQP